MWENLSLTLVIQGESVGAAEEVVEEDVDEEVVPDQLVDGAAPPQQELEEDGGGRATLARGEHLAAVAHRHFF